MQPIRTVDNRAIEDGLDRTNIGLLRQRFSHVNRARLQNLRLALGHRQQLCLDALPLLFHCNHPMLPGFVSHGTPAGISDFKPDKADLACGKTLARSFCLSSGYPGEDIWGVFLMGSTGTLAYSRQSDLDVWVCHNPGLPKAARNELQQKCKRIAAWAHSLRLEMHFFLMDSDAFKAGEPLVLDSQSSGSAQQWLLLDEFYRTALHLAGRVPIWWFAPAAREYEYNAYCKELLDKRYVRPQSVLDFGGLGAIPAGEFIGAGIWQLYKAVSAPYKSVLKLLLLEAYVSEYPFIKPLALDYKQLIYKGELAAEELDPYLLAFRRIERYLSQLGDTERLELARRCLYFKVNKALSRTPAIRGRSWQRVLLEQLVQEWGWDEAYIRTLDHRASWKSLAVQRERSALVTALNQSYDVLRRFAEEASSVRTITGSELQILGRKLQAAFERRPGKLEQINPGISQDVSETLLKLRHIPAATAGEPDTWQFFSASSEGPLHQAPSVVELLLWSHINEVLSGYTHFDLSEPGLPEEAQLRRLLTKLRQWRPLPQPEPSHEVFTRAAVPTRVLMLINAGRDLATDRDNPFARLSDRSDPFQYGSASENLVRSIDVITENSWQEITCQHFQGSDALLEALRAYTDLCMPGSHQAPPELLLECFGQSHATRINQRVRQWLGEIRTCYYTGVKPAATRYVFQLAGQYVALQFQGSKLVITKKASQAELLEYLGESQPRYSPLVIDSHTLHHHPLKVIAKLVKPRAVSVFFLPLKPRLRVYVLDEMGALTELAYDLAHGMTALLGLHQFLRNALTRLPHAQETADASPRIDFVELVAEASGALHSAARYLPPRSSEARAAPLVAVAEVDSNGQVHYGFRLASQAFSWQQFGQELHATVVRSLFEQDPQASKASCVIADLDLNALADGAAWPLGQRLQIKAALERQLNTQRDTLVKALEASRSG